MKAKDNPLISIIIPVYNTADYLTKCVYSIVSQSYRNLEIIIIDDGSTDESLKLLKELFSKDERIKIIHQNNSGLSATRNTGIKLANGEYIAFIDSDDYIDKEFIEKLYHAVFKHKSEIAVCNFVNEIPEKEWTKFQQEKKSQRITINKPSFSGTKSGFFSTVRLLTEQENIDVISCNKLYDAKLFRKIKFPIGVTNEDNFTTYKLYFAASKITFIKEPLYHYVMREKSIMHASIKKQKHLENKLSASNAAIKYFSDKLENAHGKNRFELENDPDVQRKFLEIKTLISASKYSNLLAELQFVDAAISGQISRSEFLKHRKLILDTKWDQNEFMDYKRKTYLKL